MPEAIDRPPEAPWDRGFAWRMGCPLGAVLGLLGLITCLCHAWGER
jgi:hypothetical protein